MSAWVCINTQHAQLGCNSGLHRHEDYFARYHFDSRTHLGHNTRVGARNGEIVNHSKRELDLVRESSTQLHKVRRSSREFEISREV